MKVVHFTTEKIALPTPYGQLDGLGGIIPREELIVTYLTNDGQLWQYRTQAKLWFCISDPRSEQKLASGTGVRPESSPNVER